MLSTKIPDPVPVLSNSQNPAKNAADAAARALNRGKLTFFSKMPADYSILLAIKILYFDIYRPLASRRGGGGEGD